MQINDLNLSPDQLRVLLETVPDSVAPLWLGELTNKEAELSTKLSVIRQSIRVLHSILGIPFIKQASEVTPAAPLETEITNTNNVASLPALEGQATTRLAPPVSVPERRPVSTRRGGKAPNREFVIVDGINGRVSRARAEVIKIIQSATKPMSVEEVGKLIGKNVSATSYLLRQATEAGQITASGKHGYTRYSKIGGNNGVSSNATQDTTTVALVKKEPVPKPTSKASVMVVSQIDKTHPQIWKPEGVLPWLPLGQVVSLGPDTFLTVTLSRVEDNACCECGVALPPGQPFISVWRKVDGAAGTKQWAVCFAHRPIPITMRSLKD